MSTTTKWILGIVAVLFILGSLFVISIISLFSSGSDEEVASYGGSRIAVIELNEPIVSSDATVRLFKKYRESKSIKAIVFRIESPGGGVSASQEIYEEVRKTRASGKPVVVSMGAVAASGGYYVACGADKIMANPGTLTGSIGVIFQYLEFEELMKKLGVGSSTFKSGEMKDVGSPLRKITPREREYFNQLIADVYEQFVGVVATERKLDIRKVRTYADGRVYTGRQAHAIGLVDTLGTYEDAIGLAAKLGHIEGSPTVVKERKRRTFFEQMFGDAVSDLTKIKEEYLHQPVLQYRFTSPN